MSNGFIPNKKIPSYPGVYFFRDIQDRILYIGKASNLKNRLASYRKVIHTQGPTLRVDNSRINKMLETAIDLSWQETSSEIEALILESQLIKKHRPPFNIMLRDDKQYFFVGITKEEFPRVFLTHQPKLANNPTPSPRPGEPVPTVPPLRGSPSATGFKDRLLANFTGPFTEGASLKSTLKLLKKIFLFCTCKQKHNRYCLNYHIGNCLGFCCLKSPKFTPEQKAGYKKNIKNVRDILNGKKISVLKNLEQEMDTEGKKENFEKAIELRNKLAQLQQVFENAKVIKELAGKEKVLLELQKILDTPSVPRRIEGYDISNIQGQFATGSMVVFSNGQPDKNEYRKFKIKTVPANKGGDVAMLKEILARRFNHPEWQFPDLILIDGGKGQLSTALSIIPKNISVVALTKDEKHKGHHIFSATKKTAIPLFDLPHSIKNLVLFVDSEAHRFAISYYRRLHRRSI